MDFRILGAVEADHDGQRVALGRRRERLLLGILLLEPNRPVRVERLVELLWPDEQPASPRRALQVYFSRLRQALATVEQGDEAPAVQWRGDGYALHTPADSVDAHRFVRLVRAARVIADPMERAAALRSAMDVWQGEPLAGLASPEVLRQLCGPLGEEYRAALELRIDAELEAGRFKDLAVELPALVDRFPASERLVAALMRALDHDGRPADALRAYQELVNRLREELGLEPGPELRDLAELIGRNTSGPPAALPRPTVGVVTGPQQLPADVRVLVDRELLLSHGEMHLTANQADRVTPAVFCLHGGAGVGKSAAAVRLGHRVAKAFPDGQLFLRLLDPDGTALPARTALGRMLRGIGHPPGEIPDSLEGRMAALSEQAAGKAFLVVLDDAQNLAQVSSLLRIGSQGAVILTSRKPMAGLGSAEHRRVRPLGEDASLDLLRHVSQQDFDNAQAGELVSIVEHCAGLPLALRVVGARLSPVAGTSVSTLAAALDDAAQQLDTLEIGDLAVRTSIGSALAAAEGQTRMLLERLACLPVDDFSSWIAAPLLEVDEAMADLEVERLLDLGLIHLRSEQPRRFGLHGLVRAYAIEQPSQPGTPSDAIRRYLDALVRLTTIADEGTEHGFVQANGLTMPDLPSLPRTESIARSDPGGWFGREALAVCAAVTLAASAGLAETAALLALRVRGYLTLQDESELAGSTLETALASVADANLPGLEARLLQAYFTTVAQHHRPVEDLIALSDRSLRLAQRDESPLLEMSAYWQIGYAMIEACDFEAAAMAYESALTVIEKTPDLDEHRAKALSGVGDAARLNGDPGRAAATLAEAASLDPGRTRWRGVTLFDLATALVEDDRLTEAEPVIREAADIFAELGDSFGSAYVDVVEARHALRVQDWAKARRLLDGSVQRFLAIDDISSLCEVRIAEAELLLARNRPAAARRLLLTTIDDAESVDDARSAHQCRQLLASVEVKEL